MVDIGVIGLGVMGQNLCRNISRNGYTVSVYNRSYIKTKKFVKKYNNILGYEDISDFIQSIKRPRKIILIIKSGAPIDIMIETLTPYLDKEDTIIDTGNSYYKDTIARYKKLVIQGVNYMGCGISGGEEGALNGASLMPGGDKKVYEEVKPILSDIAAKDFGGNPSVSYISGIGSGHYVKMVHNGIEYGIMQLIAETYELLSSLYNLNNKEISDIFVKFNESKLRSFLFEISIAVLRRKDELSDNYLIDIILDKASQKGTGKWTAIESLQTGIPTPTIIESVLARYISSQKNLREKLSKHYKKDEVILKYSLSDFILLLEESIYVSILCIYAQSFDLIRHVSSDNGWEIDLSELSRIWQGGCIIRSQILELLRKNSSDAHLFANTEIKNILIKSIPSLRRLVSSSILNGIPIPAFSISLNYFDSITKNRLPANLIQGLRDYFGAHTYERIDSEGVFHTNW